MIHLTQIRWVLFTFEVNYLFLTHNVQRFTKVGRISLKTAAKGLLVIILTLSSLLGYYSTKLTFDFDFEKFFPTEDKDAHFYQNFRAQFRTDNDFLLLVVEREKGIFDLGFLQKVNRLTQSLEKTHDIERVQSITNLQEFRMYDFGMSQQIPYFSGKKERLSSDSTRLFQHKEWIETFVSKDAKSLCLFIKHTDRLSTEEGVKLIQAIKEKVNAVFPAQTRLTGRIVGQVFYIEKMAEEMVLFVSISLVLVTLFLFLTFRSFWGVVLPLIVLIVSVVWVVGLMGLLEIPINLILVILPPIMFVVAMSDVIHLVSRFLDGIRNGESKEQALLITTKEVGMSTFLTSITTSIGFLSLLFVRVQPIQVFGLVMGIGVMVAFVVTWLLLPVMIYLLPLPKKIFVARKWNWSVWLEEKYKIVQKNKSKIIGLNVAFLLVFVVGSFQLESNNFLMDDLSDEEPIKADFNFVDAHLGGVRPFELAIRLKNTDDTFYDKQILSQLEKMENYLESVYGVKLKLSLVQVSKGIRRSMKQGEPSEFILPQTSSETRKIRRFISLAEGGELERLLFDSTQTLTRINGTIPDWGNQKITQKNKQFMSFVNSTIDTDLLDVRLTGSAFLLDKNMRYLSSSLLKGIALSVLVISIVMALLYRNVRIVIISLIPNLIPLFLLATLMALLGIELKITTAIVFTIAFGIAVDDTIHFLSRFKLELGKGKYTEEAVQSAFVQTGKAMILTTVILCSGFLMLLLSSFMGTFALGLMICITLFVALFLDLTLLPALILQFYKKK